jgi:shikimate dehydrogenase
MSGNEPSRRFQVVGDPVAHSLSPHIHTLFAAQFGHPVEYGLERVGVEAFVDRAEAFRKDGGEGMNVTVPHKEIAFRYVEQTDADAKAAGAVNTIRFSGRKVEGFNTDGLGLVADLTQRWRLELNGKQLLLLGAGGAARGILLPLLRAGVRSIVIANRTVSKAEALCVELAKHGSLGELRAVGLDDALRRIEADLIVNATSIGLSASETEAVRLLPLSESQLKHAFCYDMSYGDKAGFHRRVQAAGGTSVDGLGMLVEQAAASYEIWLGVRPDTQPVYKELQTLTTPPNAAS